jgi:transposase
VHVADVGTGQIGVHRAVSDIDGVTGMAIQRAIAEGERDAGKLAQLRDRRCRKSAEEIAAQLSGHWREDHLFSLRQGLQMYDAIQEQIADYDRRAWCGNRAGGTE